MVVRGGLDAWRVITHVPSSGAWNMAVDEAILLNVAEGNAPPTLRLYGWDPACISLGRAQPYDDIDQDRLIQRGWELVRRLTGGRAILHQNELTYAVTAPEDHPLMRGGVLASYRRISEALVCGLEQLTLEVEVRGSDPVSEEARANPICFEVPSAYEITVQGRKIIGSAQVRKRKTVLQHGSLPLTGDITEICDVLHYDNESEREYSRIQVRQHAATLENLLGKRVSWEEAAEAIVSGYHKVLHTPLTPHDLTPEEVATAELLMETRYQNLTWTQGTIKSSPNS